MSNDKQARETLEKLFAKPFTDYQWSLIAAQGYEDDLLAGNRTAEEVAEELRELMEAAGKRTAGAEPPALGRPGEPSLTWDDMEKLVLGRILTTGETSGPKPTPAAPGGGVRLRRLALDRERSRKVWWVVAGCAVGLFAVALGVTVLLLWSPQCGEGGGPGTTLTSGAANTDVQSWNLPSQSTTTSSTLPPATIPALDVPEYTAQLSGAAVVPAVKTTATGVLELNLAKDGSSFDCVLTVEGLTGLTLARLRLGESGQNGEEIVTLYNEGIIRSELNGVVARRSFSQADFVGPLRGKTMAEFVALLESGSVYVNVGTTRNRDGELRGQLQ